MDPEKRKLMNQYTCLSKKVNFFQALLKDAHNTNDDLLDIDIRVHIANLAFEKAKIFKQLNNN